MATIDHPTCSIGTLCPIDAIWQQRSLLTFVNIGLGSGLLLDSSKPLPEPMLTYHQKCSVAFR